jgi:NifB/MoaA-like Fe-S oxidoreductase
VEYQPNVKHITGEGGLISAVRTKSIAAELGIRPGDTLVSVSGQRLRDVIDYRFAIADECIEVLVRSASGEEMIYEIEKDPDEDLGVDFDEPLFDRLRTCNNKCPFCFLTQMPKGFRKTLYLKDDDYRLSFIYNNFVTFTNLTEDDWQRIEQQHLSPMNISVHATDPAWRAIMLGKRDVPDVREQIRRLGSLGVTVHTQIVACPQVNDGDVLRQSIADLAALYPIVQSIAVVPVGLTKYRFEGKAPKSIRAAIEVHESPDWIDTNWERQPLWEANPSSPTPDPLHDPALGFCSRLGAATDVPMRCYTGEESAALIDLILPFSLASQRDLGITLVYPSDEFYILAGRETPAADFYDDMPQYSNGVGMVRDFLDGWAKAKRRLPARIPQPTSLALVCGTLVGPMMEQVAARLNKIAGLTVRVLPVENLFFGETVTVSGLLTAQDVIPALRTSGCTRAILPRVMFDYQGTRTIDEHSPQQIAEAAGMPVALAGDPAELARYVRAIAQAG